MSRHKPALTTDEALHELAQSLLDRWRDALAAGDTETAEAIERRRTHILGLRTVRWRAQRAKEDAARQRSAATPYFTTKRGES